MSDEWQLSPGPGGLWGVGYLVRAERVEGEVDDAEQQRHADPRAAVGAQVDADPLQVHHAQFVPQPPDQTVRAALAGLGLTVLYLTSTSILFSVGSVCIMYGFFFLILFVLPTYHLTIRVLCAVSALACVAFAGLAGLVFRTM